MSESTIFIRRPTPRLRSRGLDPHPRPVDLRGLTVGLVSNGWRSFDVVLERFKTLLKEQCGAAEVEAQNVALGQPMAGPELEQLATKCDVVINGFGN